MPEYSYYLGDAVKSARIRQGLTQKQVADDLSIDDRTLTNIECNRGNPKMEILYPLIRVLRVNPCEIFYPEISRSSPILQELRLLIEDCNEEEAAALIPIFKTIISVIRNNDVTDIK